MQKLISIENKEFPELSGITPILCYERLVARTALMADNITYRSEGNITQADLEIPDSFDYAMLSKGSGIGTFTVDGMSLCGMGNTTELGYENAVHESIIAGGVFDPGEEIHRASFRETFDMPK